MEKKGLMRMEGLKQLLQKERGIEEKFPIFLKTVKLLRNVEGYVSYKATITEMVPIIEEIVGGYEKDKELPEEKLIEYVQKYEAFWEEYMKYQVWLLGSKEDCESVRKLLDYSKVHILGVGTIRGKKIADYVIVCSSVPQEELNGIRKQDIVRFDFLRYCSWQISMETAYLNMKLRKNLESGIEGVVTGMSHEQRGINFERLDGKFACLATPSQDLYLDYHKFLWVYEDVVKKREGNINYCIIGMNFYRLWYDLSLSVEHERMLCQNVREKYLHHFHDKDKELQSYKKDLEICGALMVENYLEIDYCTEIHPESIFEDKEVKEPYRKTEEAYLRDSKEVKKIFHKPYPFTFEENVGILERFLKFLYRHNIKTMVYIPPFPKVFNDFISAEMKQETLNVLSELREVYGFGFLDLSNSGMFTEEHFADWNHLNKKGADLATEFLNDYMKKIWGKVF